MGRTHPLERDRVHRLRVPDRADLRGLAPGFGAVSLVAFSLGTLVAPFAAANFEHVTAATLALGSFALAWRRRPLLAGLAAGAAIAVAYEAAAILVILGAYVAFQGGRALLDYLAGVLPGAVLLGIYNWRAFGAPWHLSYRYLANANAADQNAGFFGIHLPTLHGSREVIFGSGGLLVVSPVVLAAGLGLVALGRRYRAEAVVCAAVTAVFLVINCGYFLPYGGLSPGPRFLIPALPFLALGLAQAFATRFRLTAALTALSIIPMTALTLTWPSGSHNRETIWGELARVPVQLGSSRFVKSLTSNVLHWAGPSKVDAALVVAFCAAAAFTLAVRDARRSPRPSDHASPHFAAE